MVALQNVAKRLFFYFQERTIHPCLVHPLGEVYSVVNICSGRVGQWLSGANRLEAVQRLQRSSSTGQRH